ncbi:hypothetical protein BDA96_07G051200 [Sorghum bicolor]|uniref:DUF569 domain-containing protein n=1 Tax=Sorghum bicolor TaxID=4558 RepID=A0A921QI51_SORBI|nr:hypothetical protein BDA96_07G051200 [Sorghum bicolor]
MKLRWLGELVRPPGLVGRAASLRFLRMPSQRILPKSQHAAAEAVLPPAGQDSLERWLAASSPRPANGPTCQWKGGRRSSPPPTTTSRRWSSSPTGASCAYRAARTASTSTPTGTGRGVSLRPLGNVTPLAAKFLEHRIRGTGMWRRRSSSSNSRTPPTAATSPSRPYGPAQAGHRGCRAVQPGRPLRAAQRRAEQRPGRRWSVERVGGPQPGPLRPPALRLLGPPGQRQAPQVEHLRHRRPQPTPPRGLTTMMQWTVHVVPRSPAPLPLPEAPPQPQGRRRGLLFWRRTGSWPGVHQHPARTIWHVRANDEGDFNEDHRYWPALASYDHSVFNLRIQLGQLQHDWNGDMLGFTLCTRPGSHGRLMPLVTDLSRTSQLRSHVHRRPQDRITR